ncbi:MAG: Sulredoxin [Candidatus Methanofastidiosum methylothiophilum]|uniref:Sulredoxin n=1 Tax=Candidatus Methanofastidiosum methylothiophilum TaxID=1705564 RepID=A0A150IRH5_9EURY|nr:MAG: Sulredoxin [Candidatus Methanofastidiosum methylthiophilus]KYC47512.1 MAG: Sulredoxin [Candidatus Methanofastidiosum methylthiophilus]KYC50412.1 MAG: Sulredoxin [Candidatus Methanofastidiosum methylthiophilus]
MEFMKVGKVSEIKEGSMKKYYINGKEILISNIGGKYYAINNKCTHRNGDLSSGKLEGSVVTCPKHGSKFDVTTGKLISGPKIPLIKLKINDEEKYEVRLEGEYILVKV